MASRRPSTTVRIANNEANQAGLDRLLKTYSTACERESFKYALSIKRAMKSLADSKEAVATPQQALQLKFIGQAMARIICPEPAKPTTTTTTTTTRGATTQRTSSNTAPSPAGVCNPPRPLPLPLPQGRATSGSKSTSRAASTRSSTSSSTSTSLIVTSTTATKPSPKQSAYRQAVQEAESLVLPATDWRVILLVDDREHRAEHMVAKLQMSGVPSERRHLPIGDMAWIARSGGTEILLGTIVERKEVNDLAASLYGTRLLEQRKRLQNSGLPQLLLLVEGDTASVTNCPPDTLHMAMMETRVQLGFQVVHTKQLHETVRFLKTVHRRILQRTFPQAFGRTHETSLPSFSSPQAQRRNHKRKRRSMEDLVFDGVPKPPLQTPRFLTYRELKAKIEMDRDNGTKTVHAVYCGMLKQIHSFSHKKVLAVANAYPTPAALRRALGGLTKQESLGLVRDLSTNLDSGGGTRVTRIGPNSAAEFCQVYELGGPDQVESDQGNSETPIASTTGTDEGQREREPVARSMTVERTDTPGALSTSSDDSDLLYSFSSTVTTTTATTNNNTGTTTTNNNNNDGRKKKQPLLSSNAEELKKYGFATKSQRRRDILNKFHNDTNLEGIWAPSVQPIARSSSSSSSSRQKTTGGTSTTRQRISDYDFGDGSDSDDSDRALLDRLKERTRSRRPVSATNTTRPIGKPSRKPMEDEVIVID